MIPSSGSKIFVIAGAGNSTELIVDELLKHREEDKSIEVRVLTRKESVSHPIIVVFSNDYLKSFH